MAAKQEERVIYATRKCPVCQKKMHPGERFEWMKFKFYGKEQTLPVHREHVYPLDGLQKELDRLKKEAEKNGHGEEQGYGHTGLAYADPSDFWSI